uniref:Uncharacterized protein n=1 Tax=Helianthus annuus TaxID=4232 RepID=A0A251SI21_HELAN
MIYFTQYCLHYGISLDGQIAMKTGISLDGRIAMKTGLRHSLLIQSKAYCYFYFCSHMYHLFGYQV